MASSTKASSESSETLLVVPKGYKTGSPQKKEFNLHKAQLKLFSRAFQQGDMAYLELITIEDSQIDSVRISYYGLKNKKRTILYLPVTITKWGFRAFFPIDPDSQPGKRTLTISYVADGRDVQKNVVFSVTKRKFETSTTPLYFRDYSTTGKMKPETAQFIKESRKKKDEAFASREEDYLSTRRAHPRDMHYITSSFWAKRIYKRYKRLSSGKRKRLEDSIRIHRGVDLRGRKGTPVYAMNSGKVVLADELYYEGNMVIVDHGNRIFSYYMHLNSFEVERGDIVTAGCQIGEVGSTGRSTAPHLHVSLVVAGIQVDPLSMLPLYIR
ncbi:MAG: M23 family metallopeptidase [Spirochaetes bacterium]|nr:M23 family metallopeptidase [Spirochaetota bacterium]